MSVETSRNISYLVVNFLAPSLMFSRIIQAIDSDDMKIVGIIFLTSLMFQVYGIGFGTLTHYITPNPQNFFGGILMISALNNNGDLPIAYVTTLAAGTAFSAADGDKGVAYAIIFSTSTMISLFNCGGYRLIERDFKHVKEEPESDHSYEEKNEESSESPAMLVRSESESDLSHTTSRVISRPHSHVEADLNILTQIESHVTIPKKMPTSKIESFKVKAEPWVAKYVKIRDTLHLGFVEQFFLNFLKPTAFAAALAIIICVIPRSTDSFTRTPTTTDPISEMHQTDYRLWTLS